MELKSVSCISKHPYTKCIVETESTKAQFLDKRFTKAKEGTEKKKNNLFRGEGAKGNVKE